MLFLLLFKAGEKSGFFPPCILSVFEKYLQVEKDPGFDPKHFGEF